MGVTSTLGGTRATSVGLSVPCWGRWHADVSLDGEVSLGGQVTLVAADLELQGTVLSGGPFKGRSFYRVVAGKGGWGKSIDEWSYADDAGVKVATVLGDAAQKAGEVLAAIPGTMRLGPSFTRRSGAASRVLQQVALNAWYVDNAGTTRLGRRPTTAIKTKVTIEGLDPARNLVRVASDSIAEMVPGVVVEGIEAVDVRHEITPDGIRTTLYGQRGANDSDELASFRALMALLDPNRDFRGTYEYRVVELSGSRVALQPERVSTGMPELDRVPVRPGVAGCEAVLPLGSRVLVTWVDSDPSRPVVVGFEDAEGDGFLPTLTEIDALTFVKLADGARLMAATGDLAGGILPIVGTTRVMG